MKTLHTKSPLVFLGRCRRSYGSFRVRHARKEERGRRRRDARDANTYLSKGARRARIASRRLTSSKRVVSRYSTHSAVKLPRRGGKWFQRAAERHATGLSSAPSAAIPPPSGGSACELRSGKTTRWQPPVDRRRCRSRSASLPRDSSRRNQRRVDGTGDVPDRTDGPLASADRAASARTLLLERPASTAPRQHQAESVHPPCARRPLRRRP